MARNTAKLKRTIKKQMQRQQLRESGACPASRNFRRSSPTQSLWHARPEARRAMLESLDGFAPLRNGLRRVSDKLEEWAGIPMPLDGESLVVEPSYPKAAELMRIGRSESSQDDDDGWTVRNEFWSHHKRCTIIVMQSPDGRVTYGVQPGIHHFKHDLNTLGCADAWGIEQESTAIALLATLVSHRQFRQYMLTGMFLESSQRSGVTYMFRRLKPTVAIAKDGETTRILCSLCMHPIAYYAGTWAGAMCPTDDVVAHLMLMRGDEPMFWRRANQHPSWVPEAGL